jgi:hypothetical protein
MPFEANRHPLNTDDGTWRLTFPSVGTKASGPGTVFFNAADTVTGHVVSGGIDGRDINFRVQFDDKPNNFWDLRGTVDDQGPPPGEPVVPSPWQMATGGPMLRTKGVCLVPNIQ